MATKLRRRDLSSFYEEVATKYNEEEMVYRDLRGKLRKKFVLYFLEDVKENFLDLGCNAGLYLENFNGKLAVGVDISPTSLKHARNRLKNKQKSTRYFFTTGDIEELGFLKNIQFDFILCSEVLEHLFHPQKVFDGISRLLTQKGKALFTTPNYKKNKPTWISLGVLENTISGDEYYHTAFRPEELEKMARAAELKMVGSGTFEWEIKYATKIPVIFFITFRFINKYLFKSKRVDLINQRLFESFTLLIYRICHFTGFEKLFRIFIQEGVRSFVLVSK